MSWVTFILLILSSGVKSENQTCTILGETGFEEFSKKGDFILGGIFSITSSAVYVSKNFIQEPYTYCRRELKFARIMIFTVEEINRDETLLPGVTLGYRIFNGCGSGKLIEASLEFVNGDDSQTCTSRNVALLGHSSSGVSTDINSILSTLSIPQLSHLSTCACLSDKRNYPTFFRTVPNDNIQIMALVQLMKYYNWRWVGVIFSFGTYSSSGSADFVKESKKEGICVEFKLEYHKTRKKEFNAILEALRESTSKVVLMFMSLTYVSSFLSKIETYNITGKQWIGSESWITQIDLASEDRRSILQGAMGFALPQATIPNLAEFLLQLKPSDEPQSGVVKDVWEEFFDCSFSSLTSSTKCTGEEDLQTIVNDYTDVTYFTVENNIYKGVYALAHALHILLRCQNGSNPTTGKPCISKDEVRPKLVFEYMKYVNFTMKNGGKVAFDENGDSFARFDLVNWQIGEDGLATMSKIGQYDDSNPGGEKFQQEKDVKIVWGGNSDKVPRSVCTEPCPPGTRKATNKKRPVCCFDCFECPEGTISNQTDSPNCFTCPPEFWSNARRDKCIPKPTEYLSYTEIMGTVLAIFSSTGVLLTLFVSIIFFIHKDTPIVKANNSELSFMLLFSLKLCFLCSLTFIGRPTQWSCMLRHTAFSITFVVCISCVLGKTIVVLLAFKAKFPNNGMMKWFGPTHQKLSVLIFTLVQVVICILWLTINPPFPNMNMNYFQDRIILECALGSNVGFWAVLGYIGILAVFCFVLAFLARKLPDSFNEAKFITFSMLIFCAVWIAFIPAYVSSPGKFTVAVEIFAILASSFGLLLCIFAPKCFIVILKPHKNSKQVIRGRTL